MTHHEGNPRMTKIQNVSGDDRVVPSLGGRLVLAGQIIEVPDDAVEGFTSQVPNWVLVPVKKGDN